MKKVVIFILSVLWALGISSPAYSLEFEPVGGGGNSRICPDSVEIHVRYRRGSSSIEPLYLDNKASLDTLVSICRRLVASGQHPGVTIYLKGCASPDGTASANKRLSENRAASLRDYILANTPVPSSSVIIEESDIDWISLKNMISVSGQPWCDEAVYIISEVPIFIYDSDNRITDGRKNRLGMLHGGRAWKYMEDHFFCDLRSTEIRLSLPGTIQDGPAGDAGKTETAKADQAAGIVRPSETDADGGKTEVGVKEPDVLEVVEIVPAEETVTDGVEEENAIPEEQATEDAAPAGAMAEASGAKDRKFTLLLKTNMLYDIAAVPNIGVEIPIGEHWSVGADWMYAWWKNNNRHRFWRVYGGDIEVRRWFPPRRKTEKLLCGHHVGLYGQMLTYDFEWGGKGQLGNKWSWGAGLSYGYSLPVAKQLNIDFTIGAGYLQGKYMVYHPEDECYVWDSTHIRRWFGPTKAEISLVWFIGGRNWKKGGAR